MLQKATYTICWGYYITDRGQALYFQGYTHISSFVYVQPFRHTDQSEGAGFRRKTLDPTFVFHCPKESEFNGLIIIFSFTITVAQVVYYNVLGSDVAN